MSQPNPWVARATKYVGKGLDAAFASTRGVVLAAAAVPNIADGVMPIVRMIQEFAFPVGLAVAMWGVIEFMLDNPGGKDRIRKAIIGYIAIFILPTLFMAIRNAFRNMLV